MKKLLILASVLALVGCSEPGLIEFREVKKGEVSTKPLTVCYDGIEQNSFRTAHGYVVLVPRFTKDSKVVPCEN